MQAEGVAAARAIMARYGGAIVADGVGMGKTYIALRLIEHAVAAHEPVVVAVPATLRVKWRAALASAGLTTAHAGRPAQGADAADVILASHALVHRAAFRTASTALVVVDEAHQFRNPRTARYRALARLTARARVLLLTATPVNNRPADLYWLLRLFLGDGAFRDAGVPDLRTVLQSPTAEHAELVQRVVARIMVRRTRADLPNAGRRVDSPNAGITNIAGRSADVRLSDVFLHFPKRGPPRAVQYDLRSMHPELMERLEETFAALSLTAFDLPGRRDRQPAAHSTTAALIRIGLLKRLESSTDAFRTSIERLLRFLSACEEAVACGGYLRAREARTGDPLQLSLTGLLARPLPRNSDRDRIAADIAADRDLLSRLLDLLPNDAAPVKLIALQRLLDTIGDESRVVFTEFADTAEALFAGLPKEGTALLHGTRAALASGPLPRRAVLERFAPRACNAPAPPAHERVHTLIATDVLAEGLDLQDARHCISYDLPWNPVRLMQRAGRIDRLGSLHDEIAIWYFEPTADLERLLGLMRRLGVKVRAIERTVGAEHSVLDAGNPDGGLAAVDDAQSDDTIIPVDDDAPSFPRARNERGAAIAIVAAARAAAAARTTVMAAMMSWPHASERILLSAWRRGPLQWIEGLRIRGGTTERPLSPAEAQRLLVAIQPPSKRFADVQGARTAIGDALKVLRATTAIHDELPDASANPVAVKLATALRSALQREPGSADPALCRRADRILRRVRCGLPIGSMRALAATLDVHQHAGARALCTTLESVTAPPPAPARNGRKTLVALLLLDPPAG